MCMTSRSSLAFAQEVQDSKQMDDLMGKVTNLFAKNITGNTEQKGDFFLSIAPVCMPLQLRL